MQAYIVSYTDGCVSTESGTGPERRHKEERRTERRDQNVRPALESSRVFILYLFILDVPV